MWHVAVVLVVLVAACGNGDDGPPDVQAISDELGCVTFEESATDELFVRDRYTCVVGATASERAETRVYTFNTRSARDSWVEMAEEFGAVVLERGDRWVQVRR